MRSTKFQLTGSSTGGFFILSPIRMNGCSTNDIVRYGAKRRLAISMNSMKRPTFVSCSAARDEISRNGIVLCVKRELFWQKRIACSSFGILLREPRYRRMLSFSMR